MEDLNRKNIIGSRIMQRRKQLGIKQSDLLKQEWIKKVLERYNYATLDDMYAGVGFGGIGANKIIARLLEEYNKEHEEADFEEKIEELSKLKPTKTKPSPSGVIVKGICLFFDFTNFVVTYSVARLLAFCNVSADIESVILMI